jgi:hypothetical protein
MPLWAAGSGPVVWTTKTSDALQSALKKERSRESAIQNQPLWINKLRAAVHRTRKLRQLPIRPAQPL